MNFLQIVRLLVRFSPYIFVCGVLLGITAGYFSLQTKKEYKSHTLLNTGLISGYNIESSKGSRVDYAFTNNEMENLINMATSLETRKELSGHLLARLLLEDANGRPPLLPDNEKEWAQIKAAITIEINPKDSVEQVYKQLIGPYEDKTSEIYEIVNSKNPIIGMLKLENLKVVREGNSDMILMEYASIDPYVSQVALELLTKLFMTKQKGIKQGQSDSVIQFFEESTQKSLNRLKRAEDELLKFRVENQIINYYEQTRFIAGNREELEKDYQIQLRLKAAAESSLLRMEAEINDKKLLSVLHNEISANQNKIAEFSYALTELKLIGSKTEPNKDNAKLRDELENKISELKAEMLASTAEVIKINQTSDGVQTTNILSQWLNSLITKEEAQAKLRVMDQRKLDYNGIYDQFAPLGSTLKNLEGEIGLAEAEYLENLHSYNQARLHKINMLMSSNLKVIDKPYYPAQAEASKALMMIVLAFVVGLVIPSGVVIAAEMLDASLKSPKQASEQTGLNVGGLMPLLPKDFLKNDVDFEALIKQAMNLFVQELKVSSSGSAGALTVVVISIHNEEGKSMLIQEVQRFVNENLDDTKEHFDFIELPSLLNNPYAEEEIKNADLHVMVARADRKWTDADQHALKVYKKYVGKKPLLFLNKVRTDIMEDITGEVPRKRSWIRAKVKSLLS
jgi:succinoglycan biosynthesis transport protein ExoP